MDAFRKRMLRFGALLAALAAAGVVACLGLAGGWFTEAPGPGFVPAGATALWAPDAAFLWSRLKTQPAGRAVAAVLSALGAPMPGADTGGAVWPGTLGRQLLAGLSEEGWGVCVRPGAWRGLTLDLPTEGIHPLNDGLFGTWRDGFLLLSPSRAYLRAALDSPPWTPPAAVQPPNFVAAGPWPGTAQRWWLRFRPEPGLPFDGAAPWPVTARGKPLTAVDAYPKPPLLSVACSRVQDLAPPLRAMDHALGEAPFADLLRRVCTRAANQWGLRRLASEWDAPAREIGIALFDVDTRQPLPVPEAVFLMRTDAPALADHPLAPMLEEDRALPYEWNGVPGRLMPLVGEKLTLCLAAHGRDWLASTQEPVMARMLQRTDWGRRSEADLVLEGDWEKTARLGERLLLRAARYELIPGLTEDAVYRDWAPVASAVSGLGTLVIEGRMQAEAALVLRLSGRAGQREEAAP